MISIEQMMLLLIKTPVSIAEEYFTKDGFTFEKDFDPNLVWVKFNRKKISEAVGLVTQEGETLYAFYTFDEEKIYKNFFDTAITNFGFKLFEDNNYSILVREDYVLFFSTKTVANRKLFSVILSQIDSAEFPEIYSDYFIN